MVGLKKEARRDGYIQAMTVRIRSLCYVVATRARKSKLARWHTELGWAAVEAARPTDATATPNMKAEEEYGFNWGTEMLRCYRALKKGGQRGLAEPHVAEAGDRDHQLAQALWLGGMVREIPTRTVGQLKRYDKRAPKSTSSGAVWCGEHVVAHNRIRGQQRAGRY